MNIWTLASRYGPEWYEDTSTTAGALIGGGVFVALFAYFWWDESRRDKERKEFDEKFFSEKKQRDKSPNGPSSSA